MVRYSNYFEHHPESLPMVLEWFLGTQYDFLVYSLEEFSAIMLKSMEERAICSTVFS
jgi:hypothetical protein